MIELLVVVAIIALLISILLPALSAARAQARASKCLSNLHVFGQGISIYVTENRDVMVPGRLPWIDDCNAFATIRGGRKFRPTFAAMMSVAVGAPPFEDPKACRTETDRFGEPGDRQNFSYGVYVCPETPEWTDERNAGYGYNYQFLGNSRLLDPNVLDSYKNWGVLLTQIRYPGRTVAVGDCMGTAASWRPDHRVEYENNTRDADRFGNEGFNLDPPRVDPVNGEMAIRGGGIEARTAVDPRHRRLGNVLWLDGHAAASTLKKLGYELNSDRSVGLEGENAQWTGNGRDEAWTPEFRR